MNWYLWILIIIGTAYLFPALLIIVLTMIIAVRDERQDCRPGKADYWRLSRGAVIFGLAWLYYLGIEPLIRKKREERRMKKSVLIVERALDFLIMALFFLIVARLAYVFSLESQGNLMVAFLIFYLTYGLVTEFGASWDKPGRGLTFVFQTFQNILAAICWPFLPIFRSKRIRKRLTGSGLQHRLVILKRIALLFLFTVSLIWLKLEMTWSWREFYVCLLAIYSSGLYLVLGAEVATCRWRSKLKYQNKGRFFLVGIFEIILIVFAWPTVVIYGDPEGQC